MKAKIDADTSSLTPPLKVSTRTREGSRWRTWILAGALPMLFPEGIASAAEPPAAFIYLEEADALVGGKEHRLSAAWISATGAIQCVELLDDIALQLEERQHDVTALFARLEQAAAAGPFPVRQRSETSEGAREFYPAFVRLVYRSGEHSKPLYSGPAKDRPPAVTSLIRQIRTLAPRPQERRSGGARFFLRSYPLDAAAAESLRRAGALRQVDEATLARAHTARAALRQPFRLIECSEAEVRADELAQRLSGRQPVLDVEYGGSAFQLRFITTSHKTTPPAP